jgi:hypothetical protein
MSKKAVIIFVQILDEYGDFIEDMNQRTFSTERIYRSDLVFAQFKSESKIPNNPTPTQE